MVVALSTKGAEFIAAWEGFRAACYDDSQKNCTIGVGHLVHTGPTTENDRQHWGELTFEHALALMQADAHRCAIVPIQQSITVELKQAQIDALMSLCFNAGGGAVAPGHDVARAVNSKPKVSSPAAMKAWRDRVSAAFLEWANPPELRRRRESEAFLFRTGKYTRAAGNQFANA
jgi:GH24 family phage-related lysozyme (muramidase)